MLQYNQHTALGIKTSYGHNKQPSHNQPPTITCPYCKSTDCKKITTTAKAVNIALFGIFGNKRRYQWHCKKCGSDF